MNRRIRVLSAAAATAAIASGAAVAVAGAMPIPQVLRPPAARRRPRRQRTPESPCRPCGTAGPRQCPRRAIGRSGAAARDRFLRRQAEQRQSGCTSDVSPPGQLPHTPPPLPLHPPQHPRRPRRTARRSTPQAARIRTRRCPSSGANRPATHSTTGAMGRALTRRLIDDRASGGGSGSGSDRDAATRAVEMTEANPAADSGGGHGGPPPHARARCRRPVRRDGHLGCSHGPHRYPAAGVATSAATPSTASAAHTPALSAHARQWRAIAAHRTRLRHDLTRELGAVRPGSFACTRPTRAWRPGWPRGSSCCCRRHILRRVSVVPPGGEPAGRARPVVAPALVYVPPAPWRPLTACVAHRSRGSGRP